MVFGLNAESGPYQDLASAITLAARALTSPLVIGTPAFQSEENRAAFANIWDAAVDEMYRRQHADALALLEEIAVEDDD